MEFLSKFYHSGYFTACIVILIAAVAVYILRVIYDRICHSILPLLRYERHFADDGVFENDNTELIEVIYNPTPFPLIFVDVEGYIYNDLRVTEFEFDNRKGMQFFKSRFILLLPYMRIQRRHEVICKKRGYYKLESVQLFLAKSDRHIDCPAEVYVYPPLLDPPLPTAPASLQQGETESHRWLIRDPFSLSGIRDYVFGDPFNAINFKATARSGGYLTSRLKVNERDFCSNRNIVVLINYATDPADPIPTKIYETIQEEALGKASAMIRNACNDGFNAGFACNALTYDGDRDVKFPMGSGEVHIKDILRAMAGIRNTPGVSFSRILDEYIYTGITDTEFYVFSPYTDDMIDARLRDLEYRGNSVCLLIGARGDEDEETE